MNPLTTQPSPLGALRFSGPDVRGFLQGQLTNDIGLLASDRPLLAAHCNSQGRVVAIVTLLQEGEDIIALLPDSLVTPLQERLRKYLLRAKVKITEATADSSALARASVDLIAEGRPQIYPETSELFVAQMLNLDLIDGISFNKGCYTGQEVIARAHYRGKVKRRMQRFRTSAPMILKPGDTGHFTDGRNFTVVMAMQSENGRCEFLAVAPLIASDNETSGSTATPVAAEQLPLPYALP